MRPLCLLRQLAIAAGFIALVSGCAGGVTYNPTIVAWEIDEERLAANPIKTVVIAHVNLGAPSRNYLEREEARIDGYVSVYLKDNGFKVLPQRLFTQHWNTAVRAFGNPIDPTTGKMNVRTFSQIMISVRDRLQEESKLDAFVFTDLIEIETAFNGGLKHLARWDGVTRKPALQGTGNGVSADFNWNAPVAAASLQVSIYDMELQRLFTSRGGLDATDAIDTRSSQGKYVRRRNMLENEDHIKEGVRLAFHPLIEMQDWPGNP